MNHVHGRIVPLDSFLRIVRWGHASNGVCRRSYNEILFLRIFTCNPNLCKLRNFWEDSDGMAVPTQNGSLTRDIPSVGTLVGLLLFALLAQASYHWAADVAEADNQTGLASGSLPMRGHQEINLGVYGTTVPTPPRVVLVGHFPPSMIGVQQWC